MRHVTVCITSHLKAPGCRTKIPRSTEI